MSIAPRDATFTSGDRGKSTQLFLHEASEYAAFYEKNRPTLDLVGLVEKGFEYANAGEGRRPVNLSRNDMSQLRNLDAMLDSSGRHRPS
jgi:hypothetical protein